jgi:acyl-CoA synthetase (AMP-forming)/AMP-acid ligase II/pimeloyl-ACP methyl ester carboxylesterase
VTRSLGGLIRSADPQAAAIVDLAGREVTYSGLLEIAGRHVAVLNRNGIGRGDRVAIVTPNGPGAAIAFLGAACGTEAAPLNPAYGDRELEFYLKDLGPKTIIIAEGMDSPAAGVARRLGIPILWLNPFTFDLGGGKEALPATRAGWAEEDDVALLLHTSGTTSRPKLVPLTHRNLCASARSVARTLELTPADRCLNIMPLFHIHGLAGAVLSTLYAGASIVCTRGLDAARFPGWLERTQATWYTAVPAMHQAILSTFTPSRHRLRLIRSSSAALAPQVMAEMENAFGVPVIEAYGMTEAAHQMASNPLPPRIRKPGSVGVAAGVEIAIIEGEVCIRGESVTTRYAANPEATAAAFKDGWFRTGDLGRFDEDRYLFLTGRLKEIINRGGEKIAPREIDEVLLEHPGVAQAVAFAVPHKRLGEDVAVAVVLREGVAVTERELVEFAASRLADFKVPGQVVFLEEMPKGPTGKVQRIGMAGTLGLGGQVGRPRGSPAEERSRTELEEKLQAIWSEVLRVGAPGRQEDFFDLGGDSLFAAQIAFRVKETTGLALPLVTFRTAPTIAGMAAVLEGEASKAAEGLVSIRHGIGSAPLFCISGHDGGLMGFSHLARHLPEGMQVCAFKPPAAGDPVTVEALAERYIESMRAQQRAGPYYLLGHCFGGFVAYEMACRLQAEGEKVGLLVLLECFHNGWFRRLSGPARMKVRAAHLLRRARFHASRALRAHSLSAYLRDRAGAMRKARREQIFREKHRKAMLEFEAGQFNGPALLIAPEDPRAGRYPAPLLGWQGLLTGEVECAEAPDELAGVLSEGAAARVAEILSKRLSRGSAA